MHWFPLSPFQGVPLALHLSDHAVTLVLFNRRRAVRAFAYQKVPDGIIEDGIIKQPQVLAELVRELGKNARPSPIALSDERSVVLSIPESKAFTHVFRFAKEAGARVDISARVTHEAAQFVPVELEKLYWDVEVLEENDESILAQFAAAPRELLDSYVTFAGMCNLTPIAVELEGMSLGRSLLGDDARPTLVMDIGARMTNLSFFDPAHRLSLSISIPIAGNSFTRALTDRLNISWSEAETMKAKQGLDRKLTDNRALIILQERMQAILRDLEKAIAYFEETVHARLERVLLAGSSSLIPDLDTYFRMNLKREVVIGRPFGADAIALVASVGTVSPLTLAPAIGLALRAAGPDPVHRGINILHGWEGERWAVREKKILTIWRRLALPIFFASIVLLGYVLYSYIYLPLERLKEEQAARVPLNIVYPVEVPQPQEAGTESDQGLEEGEGVPSEDASVSTGTPATAGNGEGMPPSASLVRVLATPTGWLNVRAGPGTNFELLGRIYPTETYQLLETRDAWANINVFGGGWVSVGYVEVIEDGS